MLATLQVAALPVLIGSQQPARGPEARGATSRDHASLAGAIRAIDLSGHYLKSACGESGKFAYRLNPYSGRLSPSYNIVRHAGAMYALAMLDSSHPDRKAVDAMLRAAAFLRAAGGSGKRGQSGSEKGASGVVTRWSGGGAVEPRLESRVLQEEWFSGVFALSAR